MRHPTLVAFAVTTATLAPAALVVLDAGPAQRAKLFANRSRTALIDDAQITVALDRNFTDAGGTVHVKLGADKPARVAVVVVGSSGNEEQRMEAPPRAIAHEIVDLTADASGTIAAAVPVRLSGAALEGGSGALAHYQIYVMAPDVADKLERWRVARTDRQRRAAVAPASSELAKLTNNIEATWTPEDRVVTYRPKSIAALDAYTRRRYAGFTIEVANRARIGEPFVAAVAIKNPTKQPATVTVDLRMPLIDENLSSNEAVTIAAPAITTVTIPPGQTSRVEFEVTATHKGTLALEAALACDEVDCALPYQAPAFEAVDIIASKQAVARR
jgi:hypothetical protein